MELFHRYFGKEKEEEEEPIPKKGKVRGTPNIKTTKSSTYSSYSILILLISICIPITVITFQYSSSSSLVETSRIENPIEEEECKLGSEASSAINRATTRECKSQIRQIACSTYQELYPLSLPNKCPLKRNHIAEKDSYYGCFKDSFQYRLLSGSYRKFKDSNNPEKCLNLCRDSGYVFAGLQYASECFCGNQLEVKNTHNNNNNNHEIVKLSEDKCDMSCLDNPTLKCGGYLTMNIYKTGVSPFLPEPANEDTKKDEEPPSKVKIVYLLTVSGRALRQIYRLIKLIYDPHHYIYIHVDSRNDFLFRELIKLETRFPNIKLARKRFATIWGGASLLKMLLQSMQDLLDIWTDWDFVLNLSESDYPVKSRRELEVFLSSNQGRNFIKSHGRDINVFIKKQGLDRTFHECDNHMWRIGRRSLPEGIQLDGGSDWICLNRQFVSYIINSKDELVTGLKRVFNYTLLPAESFFHTALRNSEFCWTFVNNNLHLTNWRRKRGCKCQHKVIVDWCGCSPNDILPEDFGKINGTLDRQIYFARKFEPTISQNIINSVDENLLNIRPNPDDGSYKKYWQNIYHHEDPEESRNKQPPYKAVAEALIPHKKLIEINSYHKSDKMEGVLLLFESKGEIEEHWIKPKTASDIIETSSLVLQTDIGGDFDLKELVFRNYFNVLSQSSQPTLRYIIIKKGNDNTEAKIKFYNPNGKFVSSHKLIINETGTIESIKVQITDNKEESQIQGIWKAVIIFTNENGVIEFVNRQISFLVFNSKELYYDNQYLSDFFPIMESCYGKNNCFNSEWSSLTYDAKSII